MSDTAELLDVIDALVVVLRRHDVPYFITGSFASSVHGEFRATNDIDIVAKLDASRLASVLVDLSAAFVTDADQAQEALSRGAGFNVIHSTTYLKVDVFPCVNAFNSEAMNRAVAIELPGARERFWVASVEDILLSKLWWFRLEGEVSEVQQRDVRRLVELNRERRDREYLSVWSRVLRVDDLLARALV